MAADRLGTSALILGGMLAGPVAGGQLMLLGKPLGGVLGVPGSVVGYVALTALVSGSATAILGAKLDISPRLAGAAALFAGGAFVVTGLASTPWIFTVAVVCAGVLTGPVLICGRMLAWRDPATLTGWHVAMASGLAGAAATAAACGATPGRGLLGAGIATAVLGVVAAGAKYAPASPNSGTDLGDTRMTWQLLAAYAAAGLLVGGTVLPALHLLLFRWDALGREQAMLLLPAALLATVVVALPGPDVGSIAPLLILAAGGPVLVATAPGRATLAIGLAVTVAAAARAAHGLDLAAPRSPHAAAVTVLVATAAGSSGLGLVSALGRFSGTGTALTVLAIPGSMAALLYALSARTPAYRTSTADPVLEGGIA